MYIDLIIQAVLSPVLIVQALRTRAKAAMLPEPPGVRSGVLGVGPEIRLLVFGDSAAAGVGAPTQDAAILGQLTSILSKSHRVVFDMVAATGARTTDALPWLDDLPHDRYDYVVTSLGVNDVTKLVLLPVWLKRQAAMFDRFTAEYGVRRVVVTGLPPMGQFPLLPNPMSWVLGRRARRFDQAIGHVIASRPDCVRVPVDPVLEPSVMAPDGFHPGPVVHARWAQLAAAEILADLSLLDAGRATA